MQGGESSLQADCKPIASCSRRVLLWIAVEQKVTVPLGSSGIAVLLAQRLGDGRLERERPARRYGGRPRLLAEYFLS